MNYTHNHDILAIGPHPDDVEVGCGALLHQEIQNGKSVVIVDMTPSQLSSYGDPTTRVQESQQAATILGVKTRINLNLHDLSLQDDELHRLVLAKVIRTYRPRTILIPHPEDRHPDHRIIRDIVRNACFLSGLSSIDIEGLAPYRPQLVVLYPIRAETIPDFVIPLSAESLKIQMEAILSYRSQHKTNNHCFEYLKARAITAGFRIKQDYGIALNIMDSTLSIPSLDHLSSGIW